MREVDRQTSIVGRHRELETIDRFLASMRDGPTVLAISGEAGIGKTTLWHEAVERARGSSAVVLGARPTLSEEQLPFAALIDLFETILEDALRILPEPQRRALEVALLRRDAAATRSESQTVSVATLTTIVNAARRDPLLIAIDDVQWIDKPSRRVIEFVGRRLRHQPVGILTTERSTDDPMAPFPLAPTVDDDRSMLVTITSLPKNDIVTLVRDRFDMRLGPIGSARLDRMCAGNPFFALEISRYLQRRGLSLEIGDDLDVPASLRHVVSERLGNLSPTAREVTLVAAASITPTMSSIRALVVDADEGLLEAVEGGVLTFDGPRIGVSHPLLASVVYSDTPVRERKRLHERLAAVTGGEERARHLAAAAVGSDESVAGELLDAARAAHARGAPETAADLAHMSARLTPDDLVLDKATRISEAATYLLEAGDTTGAVGLFDRAAREAPEGVTRASARRGLAAATFYLGRFSEAERLFLEALDEPGITPEVAASCYEGMGIIAWLSGRGPQAAELARHARKLARTAGDRVLLAECSAETAFYETFLGNGIPIADMGAALALEDPSRYVRLFRRPTFWNTFPLLWLDDVGSSRDTARALSNEARDHGELTSLPWCLVKLAEDELRLGNLDDAREAAAESVFLADEIGQEFGLAEALICRGVIGGYMGKLGDARSDLEAARGPSARGGAFWADLRLRWSDAVIATAVGDHPTVIDRLDPLPERMEKAGFLDPAAWRFLPELIEALVAVGRVDDAVAILGPVEERSRRLGRRWAIAVASRSRALIEFERTGGASAFDHLDESAAIETDEQQPFELGRTLLVRGVLERRANRKKDARATLERAAALFEDRGAMLWCDRVRQELARIGGRAPAPSDLTETERRIAELVSHGKTNREIAGALFISPKTVEANLTRIYRKLEIGSRTELVRSFLHRDH